MKRFWLAIVLILAVLAASTSATSSSSEPNDEYDLQSLLWEHDAIFNSVLEWAQQKGVLTLPQANALQSELELRLKAFAANEGSDVDARRRIYSFISSRLSVANLLAGLGLILLSLLTLAVVAFFANTPMVTVVSIIGIAVWWWIASSLGQSVQWQVLGVSIFVIPTALIGTASYGILVATSLPSTPFEFLFPELCTIVFGLFIFFKFGFSFLLVPVLIAAYCMWIDITCIFSGKTNRIDREFFNASWVFGLAIIFCGSYLESERTHLGFWFYMVGGFTFIGGLLPFILFSPDLFNEVVFLTSAAGMIYSGTTIQRSILLIYGGVAITVYVVKSVLTLNTSCNVSNSSIYFRALFSVLFFSLAVARYAANSAATSVTGSGVGLGSVRSSLASYSGFAEYGCGFWLLVMHTISWPIYVTRHQNTPYRALTFTAHLVTTIGLVGLSRVMSGMTFSVISVVFGEGIDCGTIVAFVSGIGLVLNHCSALILDIGVGLGIANQQPTGSYHPQGTSSMIKPGVTSAKSPGGFSASRMLIIVLVGFLSHVTPTVAYARSSVMSLLFLSWVEFIYKSPNHLKKQQIAGAQWIVSACAFCLAHHFELSFLVWLCFGCMAGFTHMAARSLHRATPAILLGWAVIGIIQDSRLVQGSTILFLAVALLHVSKNTKKPKHRVAHVLSLLGLVLVAAAGGYFFFNYDYFRSLEGGLMETINQSVADSIQFVRHFVDSVVNPADFSILHLMGKSLAWPLPLSNALISEGDYVLSILIMIGVITTITEGGTWIYSKYFKESPIDESVPALMEISQMTVHFPKDTNENGIVIGLKGEKPPGFEMDNATLYVIGDEFWSNLSVMYGVAEIEAFRRTSYPFKLFPHRLSKKHFHTPDEQMWLHFGTSLNKEHAFSQSNIRSTLRKLVSSGDPEFTIRVVYSSRKASPKKALLFEFDIRPGLILNSIREGFLLKPLLADW